MCVRGNSMKTAAVSSSKRVVGNNRCWVQEKLSYLILILKLFGAQKAIGLTYQVDEIIQGLRKFGQIVFFLWIFPI